MADEIEKLKKPAKKQIVRYFSDKKSDDSEPVERIKVNNKKQAQDFKGNVIRVREKAKFFIPKSGKWNSSAQQKQKFQKNKKKKLELTIDPYAKERHSRGAATSTDGIKTEYFKEKFKRKEVYYEFANEQAARAELLLNEEEGFIEAEEEGVSTAEFSQKEIIDNVDITSASKHFNLDLDFGPYRMRYTKNGRHLLLGGKMGHVAAFDWVTKKLHCEMNVMEEVTDVSWLHVETMFAVAQKSWVYFYDNQGTELHCVKQLYRVTRLEFLPYHFLIASGSDQGFLSWLDVSTGTMVANYSTRLGPVRMMAQNPYNAVLCLGGSKGVVSMWSPTVREPLAKMLCHSTPLCALTVDPKGTYLATAGLDRRVKIWDIRALSGPVVDYKLRTAANEVAMSQKGLLAIGMGNVCEIYRKPNLVSVRTPYLRHRCPDQISGIQFCPYEDVLGISTHKGYTSILVPGSGEPNFDALEANPYQTKSQRKESEVHALLDKIPPELIKLNPDEITQVDVPSLRENIEAKKSLLYIKAPTVDFKQRNKMKGKGGSVNAFKAKHIVRDQVKKQFLRDIKGVKDEILKEAKRDIKEEKQGPTGVLDRFKAKKRTK